MIRLPQSVTIAWSVSALILFAAPNHVAAQEPTGDNSEIGGLIASLEKGQEPADRAEAAKRLHEIAHHPETQDALPILRRVVLNDPDAAVRAEAVQALAQIAFSSQPRLCPVEVFKAWSDDNEEVRDWARAYAGLFVLIDPEDPQKRSFAHNEPGAEELLLQYVKSKDPVTREASLYSLAYTARPSDAAREAVLAARDDKHFNVRNSAHITYFRLTDKLADIFPYYVRAMEELQSPELSDEESAKLGEKESAERCHKNLILLGIPIRFVELASQRQDEAAAEMMALLRDESADTRRQAATFLGRFGFQVGEEPPALRSPFSPFTGEGEASGGSWLRHLLPYLENDDYHKLFQTPSADGPANTNKSYIAPSDAGSGAWWNRPAIVYSKIADGTSNRIILGEHGGVFPQAMQDGSVRLIHPDLRAWAGGSRPGDGFVHYFSWVLRTLTGMDVTPSGQPEAIDAQDRDDPPAEEQQPSSRDDAPQDESQAEPGELKTIDPEPRKPTMDWLTTHGLLDELKKLAEADGDEKVRQAAKEALERIEKQRKMPLDGVGAAGALEP